MLQTSPKSPTLNTGRVGVDDPADHDKRNRLWSWTSSYVNTGEEALQTFLIFLKLAMVSRSGLDQVQLAVGHTGFILSWIFSRLVLIRIWSDERLLI
jgi:hypothetical protein